MNQPAWLAEAWREFGQAERAGALHNPRIVKLYADAGHASVANDEVAWCAAFLGACLARSGIRGTGSLMARSYASWGKPVAEPEAGCIAVLTRTADPALGHVGFVVGATADTLFLLGGNQSDAVSVAAFPKSRLVAVRWPEPPKAADPAQPLDIFDRALAHVLEMEGGFSDDPYDPGGATNQGITLATFASWKGEALNAMTMPRLLAGLKAITPHDVREIYLKRYWRTAGCPQLPPALALMQFDTGVNHGPGTAIRILQQIAGADVDGEIGPQTLAAVRAMPPLKLLDAYAANRRERYRAMPHFWRFGRGWLARVDKTLALARAIASETSTSKTSKGDATMTETTTETAGKWWGNSMTIWGALTTGLAAILPVFGPLFGLDLTGELIGQLGTQAVAAGQAIVVLLGTVLTITGRTRAAEPIERRIFNVRI
ncbi:MAG: TIGR02594 family protein [Hyphomicrobiaceae bacterium]|nr:TIGR02594 family protein [Hyphomicrobiaceae bacterium]